MCVFSVGIYQQAVVYARLLHDRERLLQMMKAHSGAYTLESRSVAEDHALVTT